MYKTNQSFIHDTANYHFQNALSYHFKVTEFVIQINLTIFIMLYFNFLHSVKNLIRIPVCIFALSISFSSAVLNAQVLQDSVSLNLIKEGVGFIYNMQFAKAEEIYGKINKLYPDSPVVLFFKGMITYWENYPLTPISVARTSFEKDMKMCIELSAKGNNKHNEAELLLSDLCARGILLTYYVENNMKSDVGPVAKGSYQLIRHSFHFTSVFPDFFFFTGLYDYYREAYPKAHPWYRPLAMLFPKGNKLRGITELQTAAKESALLKAESLSLLSYIFVSFEDNYQQALYYSKQVHELYPSNPEYLADYIKNLLLAHKYDEAENIIHSAEHGANKYLNALLSVFNGIIQEKKYHNYPSSENYYNLGIKNTGYFGEFANEYAAYAYFGLSRLCDIKGDKINKKIYRKKAGDLAENKKNDFDD